MPSYFTSSQERQYEAIKRSGLSKASAAKIVNARRTKLGVTKRQRKQKRRSH